MLPATNIVYGIIEQIKNLDYATMLPNGSPDPGDPNNAPQHLYGKGPDQSEMP